MGEGIEICNFLGIMKSVIVKIKDKDLQTLEEVQDKTNTGTVCGICIPDSEDIFKKINN